MNGELKQTILNTVDDLVGNFLFYDRKEDENLPNGAIEDALEGGVITLDEIVERFRNGFQEKNEFRFSG